MKKILSVFILFFVFGCASPSIKALKYTGSVGILEDETKIFNGESNASLDAAFAIAFTECREYFEKGKKFTCLKRSSYTPSGFTWLWPNNNEVKMYKIKKEKDRIAEIKKKKKLLELAKKQKLNSLETSFGEACTGGTFKKGFTKGTQEYEDCLFKKEKEAIAKQKALDEKLAKMTPVQRREYNCENAFKFRRGTNDFNQCVFKLYTTELELEKLELQKQVALANERAAKAQAAAAASAQARAEAVAAAQIAAAEAQKKAAKSQSLANSLSLMQLGSSMMSGSSPNTNNNSTGRVRTTCRNVGGFLNCY